MPEPFDPDTEDRRPDSDRSPYDYDDDYEDDPFVEAEASDNQLRLFDDSDMVELSLDDLRDMDGPDA